MIGPLLVVGKKGIFRDAFSDFRWKEFCQLSAVFTGVEKGREAWTGGLVVKLILTII